ncbi:MULTISPECIES: GNAT family N-acetyltransferase [unclassified Schlesneria]|uniref:GNAT family N-acetyltransferase n=1 Tax=unclassified Schlesneria TaxID=2762017 RepID=UPI002F1B32A7
MTEDLPQEIKTDRLLLRRWRESDGPLFAQMNADPKVMECFPSLLTREESDESMRRICEHFDEHGFGLWAVEVPGTAEFIGYVGLKYPTWQAWFTPCVEVGWRIDSRYWGNGYAPEAAKASLEFAFHAAGLKEIYSFTVPHNLRSRRVMEKIGMTHMQEHDFAHPILAPDHPLSRHVLYRISRSDFARS